MTNAQPGKSVTAGEPKKHGAPVADASADAPVPHEELAAEDDQVIGRAFRWSLAVMGVAALAIFAFVLLRPGESSPAPQAPAELETPKPVEARAVPPSISFTDVTTSAGIIFVHENGATGEKLLPESLGGGVAFLDFDSDGDQDLLFVNGDYWPGDPRTPHPTMALYRNNGKGTFADATVEAGLNVSFYGMGAAVGDYDNDGWVDIFVSAVGPNRLFRNVHGRFQEVTAVAGVAGAEEEWSTSTAFVDYDNDGDLDLFVCNYVRWSQEIDFDVDYRLIGVGRAYGPPMNYEGRHPYLYRNNGDGSFTDVSAEAGVQITNPAMDVPVGKALGVSPIDVDRDGWMDFLVANDTVRNFFFHNRQDGTFQEKGVAFGLAFDRNGSATGAMGIDAGYYRENDDLGFFIGNFSNEMTSLYVSQGTSMLFADEAIGEGIGATTRLMLSFGLFLFDYDLDGRLDLLQANGHLEEEINIVQPSQHYEQPAQLFWNAGPDRRGCFVPVANDTVGDLAKPIVGRGAAYADIDADGDLDTVLTQIGRRPLLLRNDQDLGHHWVRLHLVGTTCNRNAVGARVEATVGGRMLQRRVMPARSYLSQVELPVTLGLGAATKIDQLRIIWPGGVVQTFEDVAGDAAYSIREGDALSVLRPARR